jgi:hypothetical protein
MEDPNVIFPIGKAWAYERAPPKKSLYSKAEGGDLPESQARTADQWILNVIEAIHWYAPSPLQFGHMQIAVPRY